MGNWDLDRRATAAALVWVLGLLGVLFAADWLYQRLLGRVPELVAHGLKIFFIVIVFLPVWGLAVRIEYGRSDHISFWRAVPLTFAVVAVVEIVRAFI